MKQGIEHALERRLIFERAGQHGDGRLLRPARARKWRAPPGCRTTADQAPLRHESGSTAYPLLESSCPVQANGLRSSWGTQARIQKHPYSTDEKSLLDSTQKGVVLGYWSRRRRTTPYKQTQAAGLSSGGAAIVHAQLAVDVDRMLSDSSPARARAVRRFPCRTAARPAKSARRSRGSSASRPACRSPQRHLSSPDWEIGAAAGTARRIKGSQNLLDVAWRHPGGLQLPKQTDHPRSAIHQQPQCAPRRGQFHCLPQRGERRCLVCLAPHSTSASKAPTSMSLRLVCACRRLCSAVSKQLGRLRQIIRLSPRQQCSHLGEHGLFPKLDGNLRCSTAGAPIQRRRWLANQRHTLLERLGNGTKRQHPSLQQKLAQHGDGCQRFVCVSLRQGRENQARVAVEDRPAVRRMGDGNQVAETLFSRRQLVALIVHPAQDAVRPRNAQPKPCLVRQLLESLWRQPAVQAVPPSRSGCWTAPAGGAWPTQLACRP